MAVKYQVDGNVFLEIKTNWLCASVNEFLIQARQLDTDQAGNTIEYFQLNDSRVFTRQIPSSRTLDIPQASNTNLRDSWPVIRERSVTQPR
jgi:hypothetical protein